MGREPAFFDEPFPDGDRREFADTQAMFEALVASNPNLSAAMAPATRVNDRLYFTLASGVVYVLDAAARPFDGAALLAVNDLGPAGQVWTANSISYADGRLYHRTGAEVICFGR